MQFAWAWKNFSFWPRFKRPTQKTGDDRDVCAGDEQADAWFERAELAIGRARAFRKKDENVSRIGEQLPAKFKAMAAISLTRERNRVDDDCGDGQSRNAHEEIVLRRCRKGAMQFAQRQRGQQTKRI